MLWNQPILFKEYGTYVIKTLNVAYYLISRVFKDNSILSQR